MFLEDEACGNTASAEEVGAQLGSKNCPLQCSSLLS